jgi:hypothetical protein
MNYLYGTIIGILSRPSCFDPYHRKHCLLKLIELSRIDLPCVSEILVTLRQAAMKHEKSRCKIFFWNHKSTTVQLAALYAAWYAHTPVPHKAGTQISD